MTNDDADTGNAPDEPQAESLNLMDNERLHEIRRAIEAILMVSDQPVEGGLLAQLLEAPVDEIEQVCVGLRGSYEKDGRGFVLQKVAGGWRFQTHADLAPYVERFVLSGQVARLSAAAMETLAIIAYKQPISRNQVSAIRGVNCDGVARTLESRGYIHEVARDPGPGQAVLYGTTNVFLERLGLATLNDLPPLGQFVPNTDIVEALETTLMVGDEPEIVLGENADDDATEGDAAAVDVDNMPDVSGAAPIDPFAEEEDESEAPRANASAAGASEEE